MAPQKASKPDFSPEQKATAELIKRIRKLRWIGMEAEADLAQAELASCGVMAAAVVAEPRDTD